MARNDYSVTISDINKELTKKQQIMLKDLTDATNLNEALSVVDSIVIKPEIVATLDVHNENAENDKDYTQFVVIDSEGEKYKTGSKSFGSAIYDIMADMADTDEEWELKIYKRASKNGMQPFITCSVI